MPEVVDVQLEVTSPPVVDVEVIIPPAHEVEVTIAAARGKSAYEQAVENGFVGTAEEWLDSLHGELSPEAIAEIRLDLISLVDTNVDVVADNLDAHIISPAPHPAYDDMHDFVLLFENGMA